MKKGRGSIDWIILEILDLTTLCWKQEFMIKNLNETGNAIEIKRAEASGISIKIKTEKVMREDKSEMLEIRPESFISISYESRKGRVTVERKAGIKKILKILKKAGNP